MGTNRLRQPWPGVKSTVNSTSIRRGIVLLVTLSVVIPGIVVSMNVAQLPESPNEPNPELTSEQTRDSISSSVPLKPDAPTLTPGHLKLDVSWSAPASGDTAITGYKLQYKETSAADQIGTGSAPSTGWVTSVQSGEATSATIAGLTRDTSYDVRVLATNANGDGPWSDEASGAPTELRIGFTSASATYAETDSTGAQAVQFHTVSGTIPQSGIDIDWQIGSGSTATGTDGTTCSAGDDFRAPTSGSVRLTESSGALQLTICGDNVVEPSETIEIEIVPRSGHYSGDATMTITIEDDDAPEGLTVTAGDASLEATWSEPMVQGSLAFYEVQYKETGAEVWPTDHTDVTDTSITIDDLANDVSYDVRVRAVATGVTGTWSSPQTGTPKQGLNLSSNANLSGLTASGGSSADGEFTELTLTPATFDRATTSYTASVDNSITHVKLTPTVEDTGNATVKIGKGTSLTPVTSGSSSSAIALDVAVNAIKVEVTAQDSTKKTYTVTVTRAQQEIQPPTALNLGVDYAKLDEGMTATVIAILNNPAGEGGFEASLTFAGSADLKGEVNDGEEDYTASSSTIVIAEGDATATVALTIADDMVDEDDETIILNANPPSGVSVNGVTITISDNDAAGATLNKGSLSVAENATNNYTVVLDTKPTHDVIVTPSSSSTATATVSDALTFTPDNWSVPQLVTVTGVAAGATSVTHSAASSDAKYDSSSVSIDSVAVTTVSKPTNLEVTPQAYNGGPVLLIEFDATADGHSVLTQVKQDTGSWPAPSLEPSLPSDASIDTTGLSAATARRVAGLEKATTYDVRAHVIGGIPIAVISGSSSDAAQATTWTVPDAPTGVSAAAGNTQIALTWTEPADKGGAGASITGYDVQYKASTDTEWTDFTHADATTSATIGNLSNGTTYDLRVRAKNGIDPGSAWATPEDDDPALRTPRLSGDATLSSLELTDDDDNAISLDQSFTSDVHDYTVTVPDTVDSVKVTFVANHSGATATVNGTPVASGETSDAIALQYGNNTITVVVTAENGDTQTYTITVARVIEANFEQSRYDVTEGVYSHAIVTITLSAGATATIADLAASEGLTVTVSSGSAKYKEDWTGPTSISVSFDEGDTSARIDVRIVDDETAEGSEFFTLSLSVGEGAAEAGLALGSNSSVFVDIEDNEAYSPRFERSLVGSESGTESDNNPNNGGNNNGNSLNGGTCATYEVTVLPGYESFYTNEFVYRIAGGSARSFDPVLMHNDADKSGTVTNSGRQRVEFGIYVENRHVHQWNPRISGNEYWFEDDYDNDFNDAGLRVAGDDGC